MRELVYYNFGASYEDLRIKKKKKIKRRKRGFKRQ